MRKIGPIVLIIGVFALMILVLAFNIFTTVPAGHVGVGTLFGKVRPGTFSEGIHIINPFLDITLFDARQKTHKESMGVPSKDQLITKFELSIQYRLIKEKSPDMLKETGTPIEVINST